MTYTKDQIRAAIERTNAFFRTQPSARLRVVMSNTLDFNPFDETATCFCYGGRLARELGQLPEDQRAKDYQPGYSELEALGLSQSDGWPVYSLNDSFKENANIEDVIDAETALLTKELDL